MIYQKWFSKNHEHINDGEMMGWCQKIIVGSGNELTKNEIK